MGLPNLCEQWYAIALESILHNFCRLSCDTFRIFLTGCYSTQYSKTVIQPLLTLVADKRPVMRTSVFALLDAWVTHGGVTHGVCLEKVLHAFPEALQVVTGRNELLDWAATQMERLSPESALAPPALAGLIPTVVSCLLSKEAPARAAAQRLLGYVMLLASNVLCKRGSLGPQCKPNMTSLVTCCVNTLLDRIFFVCFCFCIPVIADTSFVFVVARVSTRLRKDCCQLSSNLLPSSFSQLHRW